MGSLVCFRPEVDPVDDMTGSVYSFSLEVLSKIFWVDHHTIHLLNYPVLPFNNSILLRSDRRRKFLLDSIWATEFFELGIFKFSSMITADSHNLAILLNLNLLEQMLSYIKSIRFSPNRNSPCISREVINNNQNISFPT
jgi:hypothetical protein